MLSPVWIAHADPRIPNLLVVHLGIVNQDVSGISVRRVEDITEALWDTRASPSTVSHPNKKIYAKIEDNVQNLSHFRD
jgi:transposase-like protein